MASPPETIVVSLIVARARNNVIGVKGKLPWRLRADLEHFKTTTFGAPIIMGRSTWESLPVKPLVGRDNIVVSRDWSFHAEGARVYSSPVTALAAAKAMATRAGKTEVFVIGGAKIYSTLMPQADRIYLTEVLADVEGDVVLSGFDEDEWEEVSRRDFPADERNDYPFAIRELHRRD